MGHVDPAQWAQLLTALATLLTVIAGLFKSISNGKKQDVAVAKIDENTAITKDTHASIQKLPTSDAINISVSTQGNPDAQVTPASPPPVPPAA